MLTRPAAALLALAAVAALATGCGAPVPAGEDAGVPTDLGPTGDLVVRPLDCTGGNAQTQLGCTGLYADWPSRTLASDVREFRPGFELWSDGAAKRRWIRLPPGAGGQIDVTDMNEWVFPVGTKLWKEFSLPVQGTVRPVETRLLEKVAIDFWRRTTFVWAEGGSAPELTDGVADVPGTNHYAVPPQGACVRCHGGRGDNVLGFEAVLLAAPEATGLTYAALQQAGLLTSTNNNHTIAASALQVPGDGIERPAIGLLHANCGVSCHNVNGSATRWNARLDVNSQKTLDALHATSTYVTTINQLSDFRPELAGPEHHYRVRPLDVPHSTLAYRMSVRDRDRDGGVSEQMPPLASNNVDATGLAVIQKWIGAMVPDGGYPLPAPLDAGAADLTAPPPPDLTAPTYDLLAGPPDLRVPDLTSLPDQVKPPDLSGADLAQCPLPPLKLTLVVGSGVTMPLYATSPPGDSRLFIVEKGGAIRIAKGGVVNATPFLTVPNYYVPSSTAEGGLLGMAFHPSYATNGRFWVHYTIAPSGHVVVREFRRSLSDPDLADPTPVVTLIDTSHGGWNHVGGMLAFGKDGYLYAAIGDGASFPSPARNLASALGKILRFDVDNPTVAPVGNLTGSGVNPFIWDYGLRNPWRFSFDRSTGDLYIGDVGQSTWEEIDVEPVATGKRDYGWDVMEGNHCYPPSTSCVTTGIPAVVEHSHASNEGGSITGGFVYRGAAIPCLRGRYVYGDYGTARIFSFVWQGGVATQKVDLSTDLNPAGSPAGKIVSFGEDAAGELYLVNLVPGRVYRIDAE